MASPEEVGGAASMKHCSLGDMPLAVTKQIVDSAGYEWRPVLVRVSKAFRDATRDLQVEERDPEDDEDDFSRWIRADVVTSTVPLLEWAVFQEQCPRCPALFIEAAKHGRLEVLKLAIRITDAHSPIDPPYLTRAACGAAAAGHLPVVQHLLGLKHIRRKSTSAIALQDVFAAAANSGRIGVMEWLMEQGHPMRSSVCMEAAAEEQFEAIRWLVERGVAIESFDSSHERGVPVAWAAARAGDLELLQWAVLEGAMFNQDTCWGAAAEGHLEVLQWMRQQGCPWDEQCVSAAASSGQLEVFRWLVAQEAPWDKETTCSEAVEGGSLEVLKIARQHGCPWEGDEAVVAVGTGDIAMLEWVVDNGPMQLDLWYQPLYTLALSNKKPEVAAWIKGRLTDPAEIAWVENKGQEIEEYLQERGDGDGDDDSDGWETASSEEAG